MTNYSKMPIVPAGPGDFGHVADVIATAFDPLEATRWLLPDDRKRRSIFAAYTRMHLPGALIEMTEDRAAVAVWAVVDEEAEPAADDYGERLREVCGSAAPRFEELEATFAKHHPGGKHHHLSHLATMPGVQGRGAGSALLRYHFQTYPAWDAYLEAASPASARLYARYGFTESAPFMVGGGPLFYPMWRPAAA